MIYAMPTTSYGLSCVELCDGEEPYPIGATWPIIDGVEWYDMVIDTGVVREKTPEEKQAYQNAIVADLAQKEEEWQLAKSPALKALENIYVDFLANMWSPILREAGLIQVDYVITVDNTNEGTNMYYLMQLRSINYSNYDRMSSEFLRLKTAINSNGGIMSKVRAHIL